MSDAMQVPVVYEPSADDLARLERDFVYHAPKVDQIPRYQQIRDAGKEFAKLILTSCPPSRERALALTHIESACFVANAAIARNE
jgi:hypothetical protein